MQNAAKYGIMTNCLTQNALFNQMELLSSWKEKELISTAMFEEMQVTSMAAFEASNRALEQSCRNGALTHSMRRSILLEDFEVEKKRTAYLKDPLTSVGILGRKFEGNGV